jgi:hypothetical protein
VGFDCVAATSSRQVSNKLDLFIQPLRDAQGTLTQNIITNYELRITNYFNAFLEGVGDGFKFGAVGGLTALNSSCNIF